MTETRQTSSQAGKDWAQVARAAGFRIRSGVGHDVLTLETVFEPNDAAAYMSAESMASQLLGQVPRVTYGSTWGSTSDGVGGHAALVTGQFHLSVSGVSKRFAKGAIA